MSEIQGLATATTTTATEGGTPAASPVVSSPISAGAATTPIGIQQGAQTTTVTPHAGVSPLEGAQIVPAGTEGAISLQDPATGNVLYILPASAQSQQAPVATAPESTDPANAQQGFQNSIQQGKEVAADLATKGIDFGALEAEYGNNGELSAESLASLEKAGYPKAMVDAYIAGMEAQANAFVSSVKAMAGGEEGWAQVAQFIQSQGDATAKAFNSLIEAGDLGQIQLAVNGLKAQMATTFGTANPTLMGGPAQAQGQQGYQSHAEMMADMKDTRYQKDPAFTQQVYMKINNSNLF